MTIQDRDDKFAPLRKGLLELVVLKAVGSKPVYVADILSRLHGTDFATGEGTLYPLLSRLSRQKLVQYSWAESETGPPRKYYSLTEEGVIHVKQLEAYWQELDQTIKRIGGNHA